MLQHEINAPVNSHLELRIDPGSKITGFSIVSLKTNSVVWGMELEHRGKEISQDLQKRAGFRRGRRSRNLRYRQKRFKGKKPDGWLAPSLKQAAITFIHRNDGYTYQFTAINIGLLQYLVI